MKNKQINPIQLLQGQLEQAAEMMAICDSLTEKDKKVIFKMI